MTRLIQIVLAFLPLAVTPLVYYALASGLLNLGGGEKDLLWIIPWIIFSIIFAISALIFIFRGHATLIWVRQATLVSITIMAGLFLILFILSITGIL